MIETRPPLPPPAAPPPRSEVPPQPRSTAVPQLSGPGWLAATGATLLLVAAVVVVAGQWSTIGPTARFAGLVGSLVAIYFAAEATRERVPTTATSLAVLAACVTAPVGVAAVAALDGSWPICIAVGGGAALVACELQSRRWNVRTLKAATVAATALLIAGLSALVDVPAAVLGALAAAVALALGGRRRSFVLAVIVPFVPALGVLAELDVGPGVLERMGVVGVAEWVIPVSALIAGLTLAISAHRTSRPSVAVTALAVLGYSGAAALVETVPPASIWLSVPGGLALLIGIVALLSERSIFTRWARQLRTVVAATLSVASMLAPIGIVLTRLSSGAFGPALDGQLLLPSAITLGALVLLALTVDHDAVIDDIVRLGCTAGAVAVVATTEVGLVWVAVAALAIWPITSAITSWRSWLVTSSIHATWAVVALIASQAAPAIASVVIVLAAGIVVAACFATRDTTFASSVLPIPILFAVPLIAVQWPDDLAVVAATVAILAVMTTGLAMMRSGFTPVDSLALSLGSGSAAVALFSGDAGVSLGLTLLGCQCWLYGVAFRRIEIATGAAIVSALAFLSLWWTTGTNDLVIDRIAPYGATGEDLALGAAALALLGGGLALRRVQRLSTWLAYGPGLSLAFSWLVVAQSDLDADWATLGGLVIGVVAVGAGGVRRLAAPLVIGTVGLVATGVVSVGDRLASAPTWMWIAVGGIGLIGVAALLERSERPVLPTRPSPTAASPEDESVESLAEVFARTFE